ncbi:MAG: hypothetical protein K2P78_04510 [Gemmataceae bacterium]|nr:hypothetical protein [Gemmataceae bacterium]
MRVTCGQCGAVVEFTVDQPRFDLNKATCHYCQQPFIAAARDGTTALAELVFALRQLQVHQQKTKVEFVIPQ